MTNKTLLPHRSEKEIMTYFRKEDQRNSQRTDLSLGWFRANSSYKKNIEEMDFGSMLSLGDELTGECSECLKMKSNLTETFPSLEMVLEETQFVQM